jgi:signal transduction histidine kinase
VALPSGDAKASAPSGGAPPGRPRRCRGVELILLRPVGWPVGMAGELIALCALLWRRVYPIVAPTVALAAVITMYAVGPAMDEPSVPIAILMLISFSNARYVNGLQGMVGLVVMGIGVAALYVTVDTREHDWSDVAFVTALIVPPYVLGRLTRRPWQQGEQLRAQQELIKDQAVRDERERIARELHAVIAHSISAMVVQASAAQDLLRQDPDRARQALAAVTETRRTALAETSTAAQADP